jgi:hypothetical protein
MNIFFGALNRGNQIRSDQGLKLVIGGHDGEELAITFIGEQLAGGGHIDPPQLIDFLVGRKRACDGRHDPVGHDLGTPLAVGVVGVPDEPE